MMRFEFSGATWVLWNSNAHVIAIQDRSRLDALLALAGTEPRPNHVNDVDEVCRVIRRR